jgi:hypothetical protein
MQAIRTKYLGATNFRGSRFKATAQAGSVTVPYDHALDNEDNHYAAALALCAKFGWSGRLVSGFLSNGEYAHVLQARDLSNVIVRLPTGEFLRPEGETK